MRMRKNYFLFFLLVLCYSVTIAQKEASHWYFGENAGLDFSSGTPVADTNGSLNTLEGCATISNVLGELLFYTDGTSVWNKDHSIMPTGKDLFGDSSSTQSAIIVAKPGAINIYYIFTVDWGGGNKGLNYYVVDMTLDGGLGDVIGNNNSPTPNNLIVSPTSEKITAVKVTNEDAFWVISFKEGTFYVFKIDSNGVDATPINGNSGFSTIEDPRGYLKSSPDGTKIVSANMTTGTYIYDFDSSTGIVSNERQLDLNDEFAYGVEFSPLSKKLYLSTGNLTFNNETGEINPAVEKLFQFNLDISNPTGINLNGTRVELHTYVNTRAALQLGIDGKIYRAIDRTNFLGVINNPEGDGLAANYIHSAVNLGNKISRQGLPPFIQSFFAAIVETQNICLGDTTNFIIESNEPILSIIWDFGDGSPTSIDLNPGHIYESAGDYQITVIITTADEIKTINQTITIFDLPNIIDPVTLHQCDDDIDGFSYFNLRESEILISSDYTDLTFSYHLTRTDADSDINAIENELMFSNTTASKIFVRAQNNVGCHIITELNLSVSTTAIPASFMLDFVECDNDLNDGDDTNGITTFNFNGATQLILELFPTNQNLEVTYYENITEALSEENPIDAKNFRNENSPFSQQIVVRVEDQSNNACLGLGFHVTLNVSKLPEFDLAEQEFLCLNELSNPLTIAIENPQGEYSYEWSDQNGTIVSSNSISGSIEILAAGIYYVTATSSDNCDRTKEILIIPSNIASVQNIDVVDDSDNNMIIIQVNGEGNYEYALDNVEGPYQDQNFFENVTAGIHMVFVKDINGCGVSFEEVSVIGYPRFLTPNGDGFNDTWQVEGVSFQPNSKVLIFDRFGKIIAEIDPSSEGWDGTFNGKLMPQSDYWFLVKLDDGRTRRGHFSLIKR